MDEDLVAAEVARHAPPGGARIGVACSGGLDSVVLLDAVARQAAERRWLVFCLHVDHGLRGAASTEDWLFVVELARALGTTPSGRRITVAREGRGSLEQRARRMRYAAFAELAREAELQHLLLAHHGDDQAETVCLRLLRGSGPRGLRGMPRERTLLPGCRLLRPLLDLPRSEIRRAAERRGLAWREDPSNADHSFERNRVRHQVLPALERELPGARVRLLALAEEAARGHGLIERVAAPLRSASLLHRAPELLVFEQLMVHGLRPEVLFSLVEPLLQEASAGELAFGREDLLRIEELAAAGAPGGAASLHGDWQARREEGMVILSRPLRWEPCPLEVPGGAELPAIGGRLTARSAGGEELEELLEASRRDPLLAVLDAEALKPPLACGPREEGERFHPLGSPGSRRISDILSERGVPQGVRERVPVVRDRSGALWVPPGAPAERSRVRPSTVRGVVLRWEAGPPLRVLRPRPPGGGPAT